MCAEEQGRGDRQLSRTLTEPKSSSGGFSGAHTMMLKPMNLGFAFSPNDLSSYCFVAVFISNPRKARLPSMSRWER